MTGLAQAALLLQAGTTLPLVGLIWLVQIVAYPLFARVGAGSFAEYHAAHARLITFVVGPLMVGELAGSIAWVATVGTAGGSGSTSGLLASVAWGGLVATVALWAVTGLVSVPQHDVLARGFDERAWTTLVATNWIRTALWTARGAVVLAALAGGLSRP